MALAGTGAGGDGIAEADDGTARRIEVGRQPVAAGEGSGDEGGGECRRRRSDCDGERRRRRAADGPAGDAPARGG